MRVVYRATESTVRICMYRVTCGIVEHGVRRIRGLVFVVKQKRAYDV